MLVIGRQGSDRYLDPKIAEMVERRISEEEFDRIVNAPCVDGEHEDTLDLIRWFTRRYPTARERVRWARRSFAQWTRPRRIIGPAAAIRNERPGS